MTRRATRQRGLTTAQLGTLWYPGMLYGAGRDEDELLVELFGSIDAAKRSYFRNKDRVMRLCQPGTRPYAWYRWEAPQGAFAALLEAPSTVDAEANMLRRYGLLTEAEAHEVWRQRGPPAPEAGRLDDEEI